MIIRKSFYLARHGQTDYNLQRRCAGGVLDVPLNATGEDQAKKLRELLVNISFSRVVSSPMKRAQQTAQLATQAPLHIEENLREWNLGDFENQSVDLLYEFIRNAPIEQPIPNGESRAAFFRRAAHAINTILENNEENVLIVAHGGIYWALLHTLNLPEDSLDNAGLVHFHYEENSWHVQKL